MVEVRVVDVTPSDIIEGMISAFLIIGDEKVAVVDPGPESSRRRLIEAMEAHGVKPDYIVVTHVHLDHGGASGGLAVDYPNAKVIVHPRGAPHLAEPSKLWESSLQVLGQLAMVYGRPVPAPRDSVIPAQDGGIIDLGGASLRVVHTPGHASHHMSILLEPDGILFTGDSAGVIVRVEPYPPVSIPTTPPPFKADMYIESLKRMIRLKPSRVAPTHYGIHNANGYLERHLKQVSDWIEAAKEANTRDPYELASVIAGIDENVGMILGIPELAPVKELFLTTTMLGIIDYVSSAQAQG